MEVAPNFKPDGEAEGTEKSEPKSRDDAGDAENISITASNQDLNLEPDQETSSSSQTAESDGHKVPESPPNMKEEPMVVSDTQQTESETKEEVHYPSLDGLDHEKTAAHGRAILNNENITPTSNTVTSPRSADNGLRFDFWAPNNYKRTVKRVDDGAKLCDDMTKLVSERAEIEGLYAAKLQGWSQKWSDLINKGSEYASLKMSWQSLTVEAKQIAQIHIELQQNMLNKVHNSITTWKTSNYHKSLLSWKETKNSEERFSKAQKPWAKKYDEVTKCKRAYHTACRARDQAEKLEKEMSWKDVENSAGEEQLKKLKDKSKKARTDAENACTKYKESVRDISNYNPKYKDDMCYVFNGLQEFEERRKTFFKQTLQDYCNLLEFSQHFDRIAKLHSSMASSVDNADVGSDLSWWAVNLGTETPVDWPKFEEYSATQESDVTQHQTEDPKPMEKGQPTSSPQAKKSSVCAAL